MNSEVIGRTWNAAEQRTPVLESLAKEGLSMDLMELEAIGELLRGVAGDVDFAGVVLVMGAMQNQTLKILRVAFFLAVTAVFGPLAVSGEATEPRTHYVKRAAVKEYLGPRLKAPFTNALYRQQRVEVYEIRKGWARISQYYDGASEGLHGERVAPWVMADFLSAVRPLDLEQPVCDDVRIADEALPKVGPGHPLSKCAVSSGAESRRAEIWGRDPWCEIGAKR